MSERVGGFLKDVKDMGEGKKRILPEEMLAWKRKTCFHKAPIQVKDVIVAHTASFSIFKFAARRHHRLVLQREGPVT